MNQDKLTHAIAWLLIASGFLHLVLWAASGSDWEGAVSLRKPALFGISGGVTVWSLGWVLTCFSARKWEQITSRIVAVLLLLEVALITLQYWRGVPSHFNESTQFDALIERAMLLFITLATVWIAWLCVRVMGPIERAPAMRLAIRAGMVWLLISCLLGFATTIMGKWNLMHGQPAELWRRAGVLKFPHGIALHAIQLLPLAAWWIERHRWPDAYKIVRGLVVAQMCLVAFAISQTFEGRGRFELAGSGIFFIASACLSVAWPLIVSRFTKRR